MTLHTEIHYEDDVCQHLAQSGWLYEKGDNKHYDRTRKHVYYPNNRVLGSNIFLVSICDFA